MSLSDSSFGVLVDNLINWDDEILATHFAAMAEFEGNPITDEGE